MKSYLLLICALGTYLPIFAQNSPEVSAWASSHPDVYIVEYQTYNSFTEDFKNKIEGNVVVYHDELSIQLLESFDQMKGIVNHSSDQKSSEDQEIKDWLGAHADTKVITKSYYDTCDSATQQLYHQIGALVLIGEVITITDIRNYNF